MGIKQIPTKKWIKFLNSLGIVYISSEGNHDKYDRKENPLPSPITVISTLKDVPILHIHTSLKNIGMSKNEFEGIMKKFKKSIKNPGKR